MAASATPRAESITGGRSGSHRARRWGFTNSAHFSRAFRTAYGMSPSQWRDTHGGGVPSDRSDASVRISQSLVL
ncbi:helix-turn-helix domain-containing protein [Streptomyces sp. NPDC052727]|uniref:helix-turn-helix domain-containing protein n=1 Tax=Streptomyces sp. NPDC052727 TaxID=3154854 RepID=UPI00341F4BA8